jgi:hypothetical protein
LAGLSGSASVEAITKPIEIADKIKTKLLKSVA